MKPFRFGVSIGKAGSRAEWVDKARKLEDLGYATLTVPDHLTALLAPIPALVSAAAATKSLRLRTNVLNNDFRHPVLLAREVATADLLTDGRLQLGLGAGYMKSEYDEAGLCFDPGGVRVDRLAEAVTIVKRLLEGEEVTFTGRHYRVTGHTIQPLPVQRPHPPILIGGNGVEPEFSGFTAAGADARVRLVREAAADRYERLELNALVQRVLVTDERRQAAEELARRWTQLSPEEILESPYVLIGSVGRLVDDLQARRERWGISDYVIFEPYLDAFAPVVARLAGE